jgi:hypothetical protein
MKAYFVVGAFLMSGVLAVAQEDTTPKVELGATYSFVYNTSAPVQRSFFENGGSGYFEYNVTRALGVVADLGGYTSEGKNYKTFSYLFGPRFNLRKSRFTPYVQFLFGGTNAWYNLAAANSFTQTSQNGFATAAGGGLDIKVGSHFAIKPIQLEYVTNQLPSTASNSRSVQNNLRYSAGVVLQLGSK